MRFDSTKIAIRERPMADLLDLALLVFRQHAGAVLGLTVLGAAPWFALNWWLFRGSVYDSVIEPESLASGLPLLAMLMTFEMPLASAPLTLYLGQVMFSPQVNWRRLVKDFWGAKWQLLVLQVMLRGVLFIAFITAVVPYLAWPYLNEVILLERNPLFGARGRGSTTLSRSSALHSKGAGELFARWIAALIVGVALIAGVWTALWGLSSVVVGSALSEMNYELTLLLPAAGWIVGGFLTVVRYLSYLDLRIRTEGWEIELAMRAEAQRLGQQLA